MLVHPAGDGDQHEPEWIQHSRHVVYYPNHAVKNPKQNQADSVFGPYGIGVYGLDERSTLMARDEWGYLH